MYVLMTNEEGNGIYNTKVTLISDDKAKEIIKEIEVEDNYMEDNGVYVYLFFDDNPKQGTLIPLDIPEHHIKALVDYSYADEAGHYEESESKTGHIFLDIKAIQKWLDNVRKS